MGRADMTLRACVLLVGWGAGCNLVTGASDFEIVADSAEGGAGGASSASNGSAEATGVMSAASTGPSASTGTGTTAAASGAGGATTAGPTTGSGPSSGNTSGTTSGGGGSMNCGGSGPGTTPLDAEEQAFLVAINNYRAQNGLGALGACVSLSRAAQGHSEDMRDQDYFDHSGLDGSTPWDRACDACFDLGCGPNTAMAENIAAGNSGATATFEQWRNSPGHNANMLGAGFTMIGIGRAIGGGTYGTYWTNVFAGDDEPSCF